VLIDIEVPAPKDIKLEYLPSYSPINKDEFVNTTWTNQTTIRISNLSAFFTYNLTFYVRVQGSQLVHPPALYTLIKTKMDGPSAPWNVTVKQLSPTQVPVISLSQISLMRCIIERFKRKMLFNFNRFFHLKVLVKWNAPVHTNGQIINYRVSVSPSSPPYSTKAKSTEHIVSTAFTGGTNYTFNVVAENTFSSGAKSADVYLVFDPEAIIDTVANLKMQTIDDTWAYITWSPVSNISSYKITTKSSNYYASYPVANTSETSYNVTGLSPHNRYSFEVSAVRKHFSGPPALITAVTQGEALPSVRSLQAHLLEGKLTDVQVSWEAPVSKYNVQWEYAIYYGASLKVLLLMH